MLTFLTYIFGEYMTNNFKGNEHFDKKLQELSSVLMGEDAQSSLTLAGTLIANILNETLSNKDIGFARLLMDGIKSNVLNQLVKWEWK